MLRGAAKLSESLQALLPQMLSGLTGKGLPMLLPRLLGI